jgi:secreted trypsin-like serine protease
MRTRLRALALLAGFALTVTVAGAGSASAVMGGTESSQPYSFMVSLRYDSPRPDGHRCGAVLIAPRWVVTAGHCANTPTGGTAGVPRGWTVRIGSLDTTSGGEVVEIDKFYRRHNTYDPPGEDIALLRLRTPVRAQPVRLAENTPADGTPVRILGWGATSDSCADFTDPVCFPSRLREADTEVAPLQECWDDDGSALPLCVGSTDPAVGAGVTDSGGPALVRAGDEWALAGTVIGPGIRGRDLPVMYTDVTKNADWINGIVTGSNVPPDDPVPNVEGAAKVGDCQGAVVRATTARDEDPALVLTNGHCLPTGRPAPGTAVVDQPADLPPVTIADPAGYPQTSTQATRLVYATMTGTDIALYRLDKTYAQLAEEGAKVFRLSTSPMRAGDQLLMAYASSRPQCTVEAVVPHLREGGYQQDDAVRYAPNNTCQSKPGYSGAALLSLDGNTVMGINNTHNRDGELCTDNNPCEVGQDGTVTAVRGRSYGQQIHHITDCLTEGSQLDLSRPDCALTAP